MKRTDITELFPDATREQIDKLMDINGSDINAARKGSDELRQQLAAATAALDGATKDADALKRAQERAAALESELNVLKIKDLRAGVAKEKGLPAELLTGDTEDACKAQADALLQWRGAPKAAPNRSVDHLLGTQPGKEGLEAGFSKLSDALFPQD